MSERVIVPRSHESSWRGPPVPRTLDRTRAAAVPDILGIPTVSGSDAKHKADHVNAQVNVFHEDMLRWANEKAGGKGIEIKVPTGVGTYKIEKIPALVDAVDQDFLLSWYTWLAAWRKFYTETMSTWTISPLFRPENVWKEAERYETELIGWRGKLAAKGGSLSAPPPAPPELGGSTSSKIGTILFWGAVIGGVGVGAYALSQLIAAKREATS